ncbi:endo-1,4-beta-xylanase [Myxococcota bacterium]
MLTSRLFVGLAAIALASCSDQADPLAPDDEGASAGTGANAGRSATTSRAGNGAIAGVLRAGGRAVPSSAVGGASSGAAVAGVGGSSVVPPSSVGGSQRATVSGAGGSQIRTSTGGSGQVAQGTGGSAPTNTTTTTAGADTEASTCVRGVQSGDPCDPAVDSAPCERTDRTCTCSSGTKQWDCTGGNEGTGGTTGQGGAGSGGTVRASGGAVGSGGSTTPNTPSGSGGATSSGDSADGSGGRSSNNQQSGSGGSSASGGAPGSGGSTPEEPQQPEQPAQASVKKFVGNITANNAVPSDFAQYWDQITPENEGKWGSVEPQKGNKQWGNLDRIYQFAQQNNIIFKHHVFVWGSQQPSWNIGRADVEDWMKQFCERYPNTPVIDVVNEPPPHTTPAYTGALGGGTVDWIVTSFELARKYCGNAVLIFNDYNNIEYDNAENAQNFRNLASQAIEKGAPIDALGAQAHDCWQAWHPELIDKLADIGKPLYITEYDVQQADDNTHLNTFKEQFPVFYEHPAVKGVTLWGHTYGATWRNGTGMVRNGQARPATTWLMEYLGR